MSTENMSPASKDKSDKMSKKRRREEELAQSKESNTPAEPESTPAKKQKKSKKDREAAVKQETSDEPVEEATPAKKEKKKRRKSTDAQAEEDAKPAAPGASAEQEEKSIEDGAEDAPKKSKSKKSKDTQNEAAEVNGVGEKPAASATTTTAISSKQLQSRSPFVQQTTSFYLALSPIAHHFPLEGLCAEHISPLLLTYYPPMKGVVLSYNDPRLSETAEKGAKVARSKEAKTVLGQSVDEYAVTYIWLTVDLLLFKPRRGTVLEGYVNLQNESILGLMCYNYFNAGIERSRLPKDWQWVEDEATEDSGEMSRKSRREAAGHYVNAEGNKVEGKIVFKVKDFEATAGAESGSGSINIYGTLLVESEDAKVDEEARQKNLIKEKTARR